MPAIVAEINSTPLGLVCLNPAGQAWNFTAAAWDTAVFGGNPDAAHLLPLKNPFPAGSASGYYQSAAIPEAVVQVSGAVVVIYALTAAVVGGSGGVTPAPASAVCTVPVSTIPPFLQLTGLMAR